jgi:hypothetical protein
MCSTARALDAARNGFSGGTLITVDPINSFAEVAHNATEHHQTSDRSASNMSQSFEDIDERQRLTQENQIDRRFMEMLDSYRVTSGLARAQEVFTMYEVQNGGDVATLARWIVKRNVVSFCPLDWDGADPSIARRFGGQYRATTQNAHKVGVHYERRPLQYWLRENQSIISAKPAWNKGLDFLLNKVAPKVAPI